MTKEALLQTAMFVLCALIIYGIGSNDALFLAALPPVAQFLLVAGLGFGFHWMRGKFRLAFGGVELYIGLFAIGSVTIGIHNFASLHDEYLAGLTGSVYLMVRGLENMTRYQGNDPLLRWFARRVNVRAYGAAP